MALSKGVTDLRNKSKNTPLLIEAGKEANGIKNIPKVTGHGD